MQVELSNITARKRKRKEREREGEREREREREREDLLTCVVSRFAVLAFEGKEPAAGKGG